MNFFKRNVNLAIISHHGGLNGRAFMLYRFLWKNNLKVSYVVIFNLVALGVSVGFVTLLYQWSPLVAVILMFIGNFISAFSQALLYGISEDGIRYQKFLEDNLEKLKSFSED